MKPFYLIFIVLFFNCPHKETPTKTVATKDSISITISPLPDASVTNAIKKTATNESISVKRSDKTIVATAYYNIPDCGAYSASAEIKRDTVFITVNNANRCDGSYKYHKLEAVIDNPENRKYTVWIDPAFTFLQKGETLKTFTNSFTIGDIDGDKKSNNVIVESEKVVAANGEETNDCGRTDCSMTAKFGKGIPDITIWRCYGMALEPLPDLNGDGRDEMIMSTLYFIGDWHDLLIWSYDGKKWNLLCQAKVYGIPESDIPLIVKEKDGYYINYETWDDEIFDIVPAKKKISLK